MEAVIFPPKNPSFTPLIQIERTNNSNKYTQKCNAVILTVRSTNIRFTAYTE